MNLEMRSVRQYCHCFDICMVYDEIEKMWTFETRTFRVLEPTIEEQAKDAVVVVYYCSRQSRSPVFGRCVDICSIV